MHVWYKCITSNITKKVAMQFNACMIVAPSFEMNDIIGVIHNIQFGLI